jgi:hypothetical protein
MYSKWLSSPLNTPSPCIWLKCVICFTLAHLPHCLCSSQAESIKHWLIWISSSLYFSILVTEESACQIARCGFIDMDPFTFSVFLSLCESIYQHWCLSLCCYSSAFSSESRGRWQKGSTCELRIHTDMCVCVCVCLYILRSIFKNGSVLFLISRFDLKISHTSKGRHKIFMFLKEGRIWPLEFTEKDWELFCFLYGT